MAKEYYISKAGTNTSTKNLEFGKTDKLAVLFKKGEITAANARADVLEELTKGASELNKTLFKAFSTGKPEIIIEYEKKK